MNMRHMAIALLAAASACGCLTGTGRFGKSGEYLHNNYPVRIGYQAAQPGRLLGPDWRLDNFSWKNGRPGNQKLAGSYLTTRHYDLNDDGSYERDVEEPRNDLRFEHRRTGAVIWFAMVAQSSSQRELELRVVARDMADFFSGSVGAAAVTPKGVIIMADQRYASVVTNTVGCKLGDVAAYKADFVVADVDQLKLDPSARSRRVRLLIARPGYSKTFIGSDHAALPVLLVAGLSALPEDFSSHEADFDRFISAIGLGDPNKSDPPAAPARVSCEAPKPAASEAVPTPAPSPSPAPAAPAPSASIAQP